MRESDLQQKRLAAAAIDLALFVLLGIGVWAAGWLLTMFLGGPAFAGDPRDTPNSGRLFTMVFVPRIVGFLGSILIFASLLARDVLVGGRSIGKKVVGIRVLTVSGGAIGLTESAKRNAVFGISSLLGVALSALQLLPCLGDVIGCLLLPLRLGVFMVALVVVAVEIVKIVQDQDGVRFGDQLAGTRVVR